MPPKETIPRIVSSDGPPAKDKIRPSSKTNLPKVLSMACDVQLDTRPCFTSSWMAETKLKDPVTLEQHLVDDVPVSIISSPDSSCGHYLMDLPEYRLNPIHIQVLAESLDEILDDVPEDLEIQSLATVRPHIKARAKDIIYGKLAKRAQGPMTSKELEREAEGLAGLLSKYTAGYGILETLLDDPVVQDIYIDAPSSQNAVQIVLRGGDSDCVRQKCRTNAFVGRRDLKSFVSRVKFETGLPFSEAHPVLEADIRRLGARVTLVGPPLSDRGVAVAIRKHSEGIWPLHLLISAGSLSPLLASFLWACVVGRRTVLLAGSRGAGKTTLLASMMLEFPISQRIILIEDTPEIPVRRMQDLGYDVQALRFSEGMQAARNTAEQSLRVSLRMGESSIVIGEVRGTEARILYESMRAGSAGSSVLGTIHGNSAKGVLDRAVEDLGVSERAFSSTDMIVIMGLLRSPDGTRFERRVTEVAEVRMREGRVDLCPLFLLSPGCNCAKPTEHFSPESKAVLGVAEAFGIGPEEVLELIKARAHADQLAAEAIREHHARREVRTDGFRVRSNERLSRSLFGDGGIEAGLKEWKAWFDGIG
jgi:flagellar protein FlaI